MYQGHCIDALCNIYWPVLVQSEIITFLCKKLSGFLTHYDKWNSSIRKWEKREQEHVRSRNASRKLKTSSKQSDSQVRENSGFLATFLLEMSPYTLSSH